jgi:hypothetical protein
MNVEGVIHSFRSRLIAVMPVVILILILILSSIVFIPSFSSKLDNRSFFAYAAYTRATTATGGPTLNDPNLKVEVVAKRLRIPSSMAFLGLMGIRRMREGREVGV